MELHRPGVSARPMEHGGGGGYKAQGVIDPSVKYGYPCFILQIMVCYKRDHAVGGERYGNISESRQQWI